jgi:hypothetical protein
LIAKKTRRVHIGTFITIRIMMKNTLAVAIDIKNIRAVCKSEAGAQGYYQESQNIKLDPL